MLFLKRTDWGLGFATIIALGMAGCANPDGEFDGFIDRYNKLHSVDGGQLPTDGSPGADSSTDGSDGSCNPLTEQDVAKGYLFALSAFLSPKKPFLADTTVTLGTSAEGQTVSFRMQPLDAKDRKTAVGDPIVGGPFPIKEDGSFVADFGGITMTGAANPISGSNLVSTLVLTGQAGSFCAGSTFVCGDVDGHAQQPIDTDLDTSTFTMQRLDQAGTYPAPLINCKRDPAKAL